MAQWKKYYVRLFISWLQLTVHKEKRLKFPHAFIDRKYQLGLLSIFFTLFFLLQLQFTLNLFAIVFNKLN